MINNIYIIIIIIFFSNLIYQKFIVRIIAIIENNKEYVRNKIM